MCFSSTALATRGRTRYGNVPAQQFDEDSTKGEERMETNGWKRGLAGRQSSYLAEKLLISPVRTFRQRYAGVAYGPI